MLSSRTILLPFLLYTLFSFIFMLLEVPSIRLFERAICVRHFRDSQVEEATCKDAGVQNTLSNIVGWKSSLDACAGLLASVLSGLIVERCGRRYVMFLSTCGFTAMLGFEVAICSFPLIFPTQFVWLSSMFLLIGGGQRIYNSMVLALVSDSLIHRERTIYLYLLALGPHGTRFISPRVSAALMERSVFAPFWLGFAVMPVILLAIPLVIECQPSRLKGRDSTEYVATGGNEDSETDDDNLTTNSGIASAQTSHLISSKDRTRPNILQPDQRPDQRPDYTTILGTYFQDASTLLCHPTTLFCCVTVFLKKIGFSSAGFSFQYVSERFEWSLHETTWLRVSSGAGSIIITILAPFITLQLVRRGFSANKLDLTSICGALAILTVSFFGAWKATSGTYIILTMFGTGLGEALEPALQGFMTVAASSITNTAMFTYYAFIDAVAELIAGPLEAKLIAIGRTENHPSAGICFLVSSAIFMFLLVWALIIRLKGVNS